MKKMINKKSLITILAILILAVILIIVFSNKDNNSQQLTGNESNQLKEKFFLKPALNGDGRLL